MTRLISASRPITGSSLFSLASLVKFLVYFESARNFLGSVFSGVRPARNSCMTETTAFLSILKRLNTSADGPGCCKTPKKRCSTETNDSPNDDAILTDASRACAKSGVRYSW